jgi:hypothetical protein
MPRVKIASERWTNALDDVEAFQDHACDDAVVHALEDLGIVDEDAKNTVTSVKKSKRQKLCETVGCPTRANFNVEGEQPRYCLEHKTSLMVNVNNRRCAKCSKQPCFNWNGERRPLMCLDHKEKDMIDVVNKLCVIVGCTTQPTFNVVGKRPRFCLEHKTPDMIDVKAKHCEANNCPTRPSYNVVGKRPRFCLEHKTPSMVGHPSAAILPIARRFHLSTSRESGLFIVESTRHRQ